LVNFICQAQAQYVTTMQTAWQEQKGMEAARLSQENNYKNTQTRKLIIQNGNTD